MTSDMSMKRRTLMTASTMGVLAAPSIITGFAVAQEKADNQNMQPAQPPIRALKLGAFRVVVICDGMRVSPKPHETYGTNQSEQAVADLLAQNFLPSDRLVNSYSPVLVDTGTEVILFDTGLGEGGREAGSGRLVDGLRAAGYTPEGVSTVVLTHMHGDHIGGLMEGGKPAFANARYIIGETEYAFWKDPARIGTPAEGGHKGVLEKVVPLAAKATFIGDGAEVAPGISAIAAFGHSPGHMVFRLESDGKAMMLTADTANHYVLSLQRPDWEVRFDMDKAAAAASRRKVFDMIASERLPFIGYHMPFPAVGFVEMKDQGYRFVPASYQLDI
ncbi:N-acyl homoserine lactonase [Ensifer sp. M14]|uniref:MBL fold metallo-hydrolase n=1 Tax=Ensifer sp. M14 TaxID=2203782 RepID=UPI000E1C9F51|nr:MBL fold metallo-hydrolase [Ensifer sp. M14]RDL52781.1 N-acyl homoserine lactonase [Ensifer sp. M14]